MSKKIIGLGMLTLLGSQAAFAFTHVTADITTNTQWTVANSPYILENVIYVTSGAVLDIEPGVIIRGQPQTNSSTYNPGSLVITPTAKIQARGTATNPIIFTTAALDAGLAGGGAATGIFLDANTDGIADRWSTTDGDTKYLDLNPLTAPLPPKNTGGIKNANFWGGLVIAGDSLTNSGNQVDVNADTVLDNGYGIIEGLSGTNAIYGGANTEHNGGIVKYVSLRHGGASLVAGKELNGLTLYAVGSKTTISYVDVYSTGDDGVEIFGGTVNLDHLNLTYCDDDGLDMDEGYQGLVQYVFILQGLGYGDNGLELDGEDKLEGNTVTNPVFPVGDARIYNATVLMDTAGNASAGSANAARMRAGFAGQIVNSIFQNVAVTAAGNGLRVDGLKTTGLAGGETAEYGNSARDNFGTKLIQLRNNTVSGFSTAYTGFTAGNLTQTTSGGITFGTGAFDVFFPSVLNRTLSTSIPTPVHTSANGVDPRPSLGASSLAYGSTQDGAYVPSPALASLYKGAFDRTAATLWTTAWTALNARGILKN